MKTYIPEGVNTVRHIPSNEIINVNWHGNVPYITYKRDTRVAYQVPFMDKASRTTIRGVQHLFTWP